MIHCPQCGKPMPLTDIKLLGCLEVGSQYPKNGQPVTGAVKVFACTGTRNCTGSAEQRAGIGNYEFPASQ